MFLTVNECNIVARQAESYAAGHGYEFACRKPGRSGAVLHEATACELFESKPLFRPYLAPEVWLAHVRGDLTPEGVRKALSDLLRLFHFHGQNYLTLLDESPAEVVFLLKDHTAKAMREAC